MRCLAQTGFMNFRMRAMVVSFACFGLHLSGERFMAHWPGIFGLRTGTSIRVTDAGRVPVSMRSGL